MLVLSRHKDEDIVVSNVFDADGRPVLIEFRVVDIRWDRVRFGITAPTQVLIDRREIYESRQATAKTPPVE